MTGGGPQTPSTVHDWICSLEERRRLFDHTLDGWCVWPIFRKAVADRVSSVDSGPTGPRQPAGARPYRRYLADAADFLRLPKSALMVKTYVSGLLDQDEDGRYRDIWFDDVLVAAGGGVKVQALNSASFLARRQRSVVPDSITTSLMDFAAQSVLQRLAPPPAVAAASSSLYRALREEVGELLPEAAIRGVLVDFHWKRVFYRQLLRRVEPRLVLVADFGEYALCSVAKEAGIGTYELQHGVSDRYHPAYALPEMASQVRERIPMADRLLLYGEYWRDEMEAGGYWRDHVDVTGSPRIDRWRRRASGRSRRHALLVTYQGRHGDAIARIISECLDAAPEGTLEIIVKLHPVFEGANETLVSRLDGIPGVTVVPGNEGSTLDLLGTVRMHASVSSAAHYESLALGTPTAVLALPGYEAVGDLVVSGHAILVENGGDLLRAFDAAAGVPADVGARYFSTGSVNRMLGALGMRTS